MLDLTKKMIVLYKKNHKLDKITQIIFLVDKAYYFSKINKYSFRGERPSYGAMVHYPLYYYWDPTSFFLRG